MDITRRWNDQLSRTIKRAAIALFLLIFLLQCVHSIFRWSATSDEVAHLPAGYSYITTGEYRLNPEHPPLIKIIAAYPLLFLGLPHPVTDMNFIMNDKWEYGRSLIYSSGVSAEKILSWGRLMIVLLGLFLAILVYAWTRELYGENAALFSLFLFAFEPNIIAHSSLVTTDLGFTLFFFLFIYWTWKYFKNPSAKILITSGLASGFAFASKYSAVLLIPITAGLIIFELSHAYARRKRDKEGGTTFKRLYREFFPHLLFMIVVPVITLIVLAASYGFFNWRYYFIGLKSVSMHSAMGHAAFLMGQYSDTGWWYYFPIAFLLKTPIPLLIFLLLSIVLLFASRSMHSLSAEVHMRESEKESNPVPGTRDLFYLLFPALFFLLASMMGKLNIGLRHILPVFPFTIVLCGSLMSGKLASISPLLKTAFLKKIFFVFILLLCVWYLIGALFITPHHLSSFNELIGGPSNGYNYLVDSNLDWGQDLPALQEYLVRNGIGGVILSYFGNADPSYYGIEYQYLPLCGKEKTPSNYKDPQRDFDFLAISATHLQSVFTPEHSCFDWLKERRPHARIAYTIFLYEIGNDAEAQMKLAEIYRGCEMDEEAERHLRRARLLRGIE